jgi:glycosyltransferase involved in cell wall biosynthesis
MKIGIDARFLTHPQAGGFKTYTENLITALASIDRENEYFLYFDRTPAAGDRIPVQPNFQTRIVSGSLPMLGLPWREQVRLPQQARRDRVDLFHAPCLTAPFFLPCPLVVTVHDMIWAFPENFTGKRSWSLKRRLMDWYNFLIPTYSIRRATRIITVSHASKKDIVDTMKLKAERIAVTHEAAGAAFKVVEVKSSLDRVRSKYGLASNYILALGSADPRKNLKTLIEAYAILPEDLQEKYQLAIVWTHSFLASETSKEIERLGLQKRVQFLLQVPNEDLVSLYNMAALFIFPSRYEGFGLPLLEAMSCGVPVVAANNSSIPEIVEDAAVLFDAHDVQEMSAAMIRVLTDDTIRIRFQNEGLLRATKFSWEKCARETLAIYEETIVPLSTSITSQARQTT